MKKAFSVIREIFSDESRILSSKRIIGTLAALSLIVMLFLSFFKNQYTVNESVADSVLVLSLFCFGATSVDKFSLYRANKQQNVIPKDQNEQSDPAVQ
jgi:hypothetical protein